MSIKSNERKQDRKGNDSIAEDDPNSIYPKDVFDSSKYNAMSDMTKESQLDSSSEEILRDVPAKNLEPAQAASYGSGDGRGPYVKLTPMMEEERARTIREANEEIPPGSFDNEQNATTITPGYLSAADEKLALYLNQMLSIKHSAMQRLKIRIHEAQIPEVRERLSQHLEETLAQKQRLESLIWNYGGKITYEVAKLPDLALPRSLDKRDSQIPQETELAEMAQDSLIEYLEVLGYNNLIQIATRMMKGEALVPLRQTLKEEEDMVAWSRATLPSNFVKLWSAVEETMK